MTTVVTEHGFHISTGNMKLGGIHNVSLPPVLTCPSDAPCYDECYAMKAYRQYPTVRKAWDDNLRLLRDEEMYDEFVLDVTSHIRGRRKALPYFRFSVAGDLFCDRYLDSMCSIARNCPDTRFWVYTKQYDILKTYVEDHEIPGNLCVILSEWKDYKPCEELAAVFGRALFNDGEVALPEDSFRCPGSCKGCKFCSGMKAGDTVVFDKH